MRADGLPIVERVEVRGLGRVSLRSVLSKIMVRKGQPLDRDVVSDDIKRIYRMDFFDDVVVRVSAEGDGVALVYEVKERPTINQISYEGHDEVGLEDIQKVVDIRQYGILNIPTLGVFSNGQVVRELVGARSKSALLRELADFL